MTDLSSDFADAGWGEIDLPDAYLVIEDAFEYIEHDLGSPPFPGMGTGAPTVPERPPPPPRKPRPTPPPEPPAARRRRRRRNAAVGAGVGVGIGIGVAIIRRLLR